ncbi:DUF2875 family protein [Pseudomonas sp. NFR16]|uniref:type VI lipase adapter Tla3 domain-containing protein n=1 Tax=Pseudomonas sp. NFR16 TaxID=1566248 RepID=UPI0008AAAD2A|nr:DUF2875 family protein [Pseudomonas sp. NFR16]SEJ81578.1 Protein of unknown function [Pseudomonas sp. NFR16]
MRTLKSSLPNIKAYLLCLLLLIALWLGFVWHVYGQSIADGMEITDMAQGIRQGVTGIVAFIVLAFIVHWAGKAIAQDRAEKQAEQEYTNGLLAAQQNKAHQAFSLEIKAAGLAIDENQQSTIWKMIRKKNNNFESIHSNNPQDYPATADSRYNGARINVRAAARHSARDAVAYWPLPTFAIAPPRQPDDKDEGAGGDILSARNAATLGVTLFLWQDSENTTHSQHMIEKLFQFFDDNSEVPEALMLSRDGDQTRTGYRVPGTRGLPNGYYVPTVFESMTGLLVARTDRVDRYLRPYAVHQQEDNQNRSTDLSKLWFFYWDRDRKFDEVYVQAKKAEGVPHPISPGTMSSTYWHAQLPEFWKTITNHGPGHFRPSKWLPIRWAQHQIDEYDETPTLGYLHRPVKVSMADENGTPLKPALRAKALQTGWQAALNTLPNGEKPVRVFYDSTDNVEGEITLTQALHALNVDGTGIEVGNVDEGYDIGRRLGNTGVSSALVEINLATIASYFEGGVSAVVYSGTDGSVSIQMIRPPSEVTKAENAKTRWADPFKFGAPGGAS